MKYNVDEQNGIIELEVGEEKISREGFEELVNVLEREIDKHGKVRIIEVVNGFPTMDLSVLWEDLKFSLRNVCNVSRCAVVSDRGWVGPYTRFLSPLVDCQIRVFDAGEMKEAREWIQEGPENES